MTQLWADAPRVRLIVALTAAVLIAIFLVLWRARRSARQSRIAVVSSVLLAGWAVVTALLARRGFFQPPDLYSPPPVGIARVWRSPCSLSACSYLHHCVAFSPISDI